MRRLTEYFTLFVVLGVTLSSCKKNATEPEVSSGSTLNAISVSDMTIFFGARDVLPEITWDPPDISNKNYTLSSDNEAVVKIDGQTMQGVGLGAAAVRLTPEADETAQSSSFQVSVVPEVPLNAISVRDTATVAGAGVFSPSHIVWDPPNASVQTYTMRSSNTAVAKPTNSGDGVRILRSGYTRITVTPDDGGTGKQRSFLLDVIPPDSSAGNYRIKTDDINLMGTLKLPSTAGPHPAIVFVHGSGRSLRSNFTVFADFVASAVGFASMAYDKRGVGESEGTFVEVGTFGNRVQVLAQDVVSAVEFLKNHPNIDPTKIGLIGWSQAGWIIPEAASISDDVSFIVPIVGPTVTVGEEIFYSDLTEERQFSLNGTINGFTVAQLTQMVKDYAGLHGYDPREALGSLDIPGLWVLGEYDESIPTALCVEILEEIIAEHEKDFQVQVYPHANHAVFDIVAQQQILYFTNRINGWLTEKVVNR